MSTIERLKELEAKATPGPWGITEDVLGAITCIDKRYGVMNLLGLDIDGYAITSHKPDSEFIAEMRNALPKLLAVVEAAQQHLDCDGTLTRQILRNALLAVNENSVSE